MNPTLQTIADAAGVSRSTVSLAMRNNPLLPEPTRLRIQKIAEEVGYRPNPMISALMANLKGSKPVADRGVIAFLTSHPTRDGWRYSPVFCDYYEGACEQAARMGYRMEEFWLKEPRMTSARMTTILETRGIAGVIVAPLVPGRGHLSLDVSNFAVVTLGYSVRRPQLHRVTNHQIESIRLAIRELRQRGYRRIALVMNENHDNRVNLNWSAGYLSYVQKLPASERLPICWTDGMSAEELNAWMAKHRPKAIISGAVVDYEWLKNAGLPVPDEIAVALLADPRTSGGAFAGIDQNGRLTGAAAVDMIVGQIHRNERGIPKTPKITMTESVWVDGDTVKQANRKGRAQKQAEENVQA